MGKYVKTGLPRGRKPIGDVAKGPYVPTGKPRGRPADPDTVKFVYVPNGKPRGAKLGEPLKTKGMKRGTACHLSKNYVPTENAPKYVPTGNPPGRQKLTDEERAERVYVPTGNPRGRKPKGAVAKAPYVPTGLPRGPRK